MRGRILKGFSLITAGIEKFTPSMAENKKDKGRSYAGRTEKK